LKDITYNAPNGPIVLNAPIKAQVEDASTQTPVQNS
jgi:hypothetical protein